MAQRRIASDLLRDSRDSACTAQARMSYDDPSRGPPVIKPGRVEPGIDRVMGKLHYRVDVGEAAGAYCDLKRASHPEQADIAQAALLLQCLLQVRPADILDAWLVP
jgi:hypothetical protein